MALVVNTNVSSLVAQRNLLDSKNALDTAMERLSSGKRINSAADDAAGLAIANRMESQIRGLNMAVRNANDGISLAQTAEGAMEEITNMLQRMRELSVQASNSVNNDLDRDSIDAEVQQLTAEIDRVTSQTRFNDVALLDGSFQGAQIQVGAKADEVISFDIRDLSSSSLGREANTVGALANTTASAKGTAATETVARMSFSGPDSYSFKVEGVSVTGTLTVATMGSDLTQLATDINDALNQANANNSVVASVANGTIELRNTAGGAIAVTDFASTANGTANFDILSGTGASSTYLNDVPTNQDTGNAQGTAATDHGVTLNLEAAGEYSFNINGLSVEIESTDTSADIKALLEAKLGSGYEVHNNTTVTAGDFHTEVGADVVVGATEYVIFNSTDGVPVNVTNFQALDGLAAGQAGTVRVVTNDDTALLVDETNSFVANASTVTTTETEFSLAFTSTSSDYELEINGEAYVITGDDLRDGTAGAALMAQLNASANYNAGGIGSLGNTNDASVGAAGANFDIEVYQNGNQLFVKAAQSLGDFDIALNDDTTIAYAIDGGGTLQSGYALADLEASSRNGGGAIAGSGGNAAGAGVSAYAAVAASEGKFYTNLSTGLEDTTSEINLNTAGTALFTTAQATATKATLQVSGNGTYSFKIGDGTSTTAAISTAVTGSSVSQMISDINNALTTAGFGIVASQDPSSQLGVLLTRADGGIVNVQDFTSPTGDETIFFAPSSGQGVSETLDDSNFKTYATAAAAGLATATTASMTFDSATGTDDFTSFKISDGTSTAVVRKTALSDTDVTAINAELSKALNDAGMSHITAVATVAGGTTKIDFSDAAGGLIKITDFVNDNGVAARWQAGSGQGTPTVLDDSSGTASTGVALSEISVQTADAASQALSVIDNALQDVDDTRGELGAIQNRLTHTIANLTNISTNTSAAQSRIQDADFAVEAANLAKAQVLQQAGTSMLAQANASPQYVLSLLQ